MAEALQVSIDTSGAVSALKDLGTALSDNLSNFANATKPLESLSRSLSIFGKNADSISTGISSSFGALSDSKTTESINKMKEAFTGFGDTTKYINQFASGIAQLGRINVKEKMFDSLATQVSRFVKVLMTGISNETLARFNQLSNSVWRLSAGLKLLGKDAEQTALKLIKSKGSIIDLSTAIGTASNKLTLMSGNIRSVFTALVGGTAIYVAIRQFKELFKASLDFELGMRRVNTIARVSDASLKTMSDQVLNLSGRFGFSAEETARALYEINSATITGASGLELLRVSAQAAAAGFTDIVPVSELLARALNAYGKNVSEAEYLSDVLFKTVERGINTMDELAQYFSRLFTVSATLSVSFEEINAALATLTARGLQTNIAVTSLNAVMLKLATGTPELNSAFRELGYDTSSAAVKALGFAKTMQYLQKITGGAADKIVALGYNYRDFRAVSILASDATGMYADNVKYMTEPLTTAGTTVAALNEKLKSSAQVLAALANTVRNAGIAFSLFMQDTIGMRDVLFDIYIAVRTTIEAFKALPNWVQKTLLIFVGLVAVGALLLAGLVAIATIIGAVVAALGALGVAASTAGIILVAALAGIIGHAIVLTTNFLIAKGVIYLFGDSIKAVGKDITDFAMKFTVIKKAVEWLLAVKKAFQDWRGAVAESEASVLRATAFEGQSILIRMQKPDVDTKQFEKYKKQLDDVKDRLMRMGDEGVKAAASLESASKGIVGDIEEVSNAVKKAKEDLEKVADIELRMKFSKLDVGEQRDLFKKQMTDAFAKADEWLNKSKVGAFDATLEEGFTTPFLEATKAQEKYEQALDKLKQKIETVSDSFKEAFTPKGVTELQQIDFAEQKFTALITKLKEAKAPEAITKLLSDFQTANFSNSEQFFTTFMKQMVELDSKSVGEKALDILKEFKDTLKEVGINSDALLKTKEALKNMALETMPQGQKESYLRREYNITREAYASEISKAGGETARSIALQNTMMTLGQTINGLSANVKEMAPAVRTLTGVEMGTKEAMDILSKTANVDFNKETAGNTAKLLDVNKDMRTTQTKMLGKLTTGFMPAGN